MQYYSITEIAKKLDVNKSRIRSLIRKNKIQTTKGERPLDPYKIASSEVSKIKNLLEMQTSEKKVSKKAKMEIVTNLQDTLKKKVDIPQRKNLKPQDTAPQEKSLTDKSSAEMRRILALTMKNISETQNKMVSTMSLLLDR